MIRQVIPIALSLTLLAGIARAGEATFKTCYARWTTTELTVGNAHIQRSWRIEDGRLTATSFRDVGAGVEWLSTSSIRPAPSPGAAVSNGRIPTIVARSGRFGPVEEESLVVEIEAGAFAYRLQVFPAARGVGMRATSLAPAKPQPGAAATATPTGTDERPAPAHAEDRGDALEDLVLAPQHLRFTQVTLVDQTDIHNELVFEDSWLLMTNEAPLKLSGNVFFVENTLNDAGLVFLEQAPLPHARPVKSEFDALVTASQRRVRFTAAGYPFVLLAYTGGRTGRIAALQTYQRQLRPYDPHRDGMFLSNTWGDRSRDARINQEFMLKEIDAGARLGVDVVQIDDGWQKGRTANSARGSGGVWNGYWAADPDFWQPDPGRFPAGLAPLVRAARDRGMKFGLWYGPDSSGDVANWQRDAGRILDLHRRDGIDYFKIDSVKVKTVAAEEKLRRFFDRVLEESGGKVVFDLDVTAETRPGYFGVPDAGPIFVENRYTDFHRYWPHQTLRSLWTLAQYVDPLRLRMEFLNNTRKTDQYPDDPLAPARYRPDCLFATTMFANPLGWFETSNLPDDYVAAVGRLAAVWKRERPRLFAGTIVPIGSVPDGVGWTGFASVAAGGQSGYLLLFRELNKSPEWSIDLPLFAGEHRVTVLAGNGTVDATGRRFVARIDEPLGYVWVRLDPAPRIGGRRLPGIVGERVPYCRRIFSIALPLASSSMSLSR
jgi:alpha-galactosidase